ncbi:MAG: response regulator transcription factor, partial [Leucobacter sp.]
MPEAAGLTTFVADNGLDGVRLVLEQQPFLVTLDVNMPGIDGFEAARRIREGSTAYIIMISALDGESDAVLGLTSGADSYLTKPFRPRELRARIDAIMRRSDMWSTRGSAPAVGGVSTGLRSASSPSDASAVVEQSLLSDDAVYPLNPSAPPGPPGA